MNIASHFESYRASLKRDALEGFDEYATIVATAKPDAYPKVIDYLKHAFSRTASAVQSGVEAEYRIWVERHQGAMVALFDRMVEDELWDYRGTTAKDLMDLITNRGWHWFKFCRKSLCFTMSGIVEGKLDVVFIPRYAESFRKEWAAAEGRVVFDAAEGRYLFGEKKGPDYTHPIIHHKLKNPGHRLVDGAPTYRSAEQVNTPEAVIDWSLPLF